MAVNSICPHCRREGHTAEECGTYLHAVIPPGMSRRDYFAAAAMQGLLSQAEMNDRTLETIADLSVSAADALLKALDAEAKP